MEKIGFFEKWNSGAQAVERSSGRLGQFMALCTGLIIALASVIPGVDVSLGDALPMVITLLGYSVGAAGWQKTVENLGKK